MSGMGTTPQKITNPAGGPFTLDEARSLVADQGYEPEQVERMTGVPTDKLPKRTGGGAGAKS